VFESFGRGERLQTSYMQEASKSWGRKGVFVVGC
jgi:hypothetical protein